MNSNEKAWKLYDTSFDASKNRENEALYTLANGYLGMRGDGEELLQDGLSRKGTFLNGFFEYSKIHYGESAYGFAENMQTMLNVCDAKQVRLMVEGQRFTLDSGRLLEYYRELDMEKAREYRKVVWETDQGHQVQVITRNMVSMDQKGLAVRMYEVTPLNFTGSITIMAVMEGNTVTGEESDDPRVSGSLGDGAFKCSRWGFLGSEKEALPYVIQSAKRSALDAACVMSVRLRGEGCKSLSEKPGRRELAEEGRIEINYELTVKKGQAVCLERMIGYADSRFGRKDPLDHAVMIVEKARKTGVKELFLQQEGYMKRFWEKADIRVEGNEEVTRALRFNIFHLLQSVGKDSHTSIASKGLSGEGYGGHYFWESEAYVAPVFMLSEPEIAKSLLTYRYTILDRAREQARLLGHEKGALYSWRTISGEESSAYFPAGSAQYHINADIAFAVERYLQVTEDIEFLADCGLEILIETARLWINTGHYSPKKGKQFCIEGVTGPDEYTAIVDNNCYTNVMARENLWNAAKEAKRLKAELPKRYEELASRIGLHEKELDEFHRAADHMYIPYDEELKIHMQDDTFLSRRALDLTEIPMENRPLLLHYHPLFIYRHQVCKQADLLLAEYFLPDRFEPEDKKRDFEYYEKLTTHDSSLSACVFSVMAARIGKREKAYQYFEQTLKTDLENTQKNTKDGLHMANMAGAWACVVFGFGGVTVMAEGIGFEPILPKQWTGYEFKITYRDSLIAIRVRPEGVSYELQTPRTVKIKHYDEEITLHYQEEVYKTFNGEGEM